ncbi:Uu.00g022990.m01.CDS01 [Anthostomella pinea]|uniref:Uu.00g022990.m01.CDS01 n=1 Tax=Anthostomella pinea TaxID=933095 RepID=A0AAI8YR13_9PEZI|nr:Uu.00g022990.m01.CDS01 [Anthostomella pinea]
MPSILRFLEEDESDADLTKLRQKLGQTFVSNSALRYVLESTAVRPFFEEYVRDFLSNHPNAGDPDYNEVTRHNALVNATWVRSYHFVVAEKSEFTELKHCEEIFGFAVYQAYEILIALKAMYRKTLAQEMSHA